MVLICFVFVVKLSVHGRQNVLRRRVLNHELLLRAFDSRDLASTPLSEPFLGPLSLLLSKPLFRGLEFVSELFLRCFNHFSNIAFHL